MVEAGIRIVNESMKPINTLLLCLVLSVPVAAQKPASGTYIFKLCYNEWSGCYNTCTIIIKDDSISVYANQDLSVPKGEVIEKGIILLHKSGKWIIGQKPEDINASKIGGCSNAPPIIDFKKRRYRSC